MCIDRWYKPARGIICVQTDVTTQLGKEYVYRRMVPASQGQNMCKYRWYQPARGRICVQRYQPSRGRIGVQTDGTIQLVAEYVYRHITPASQWQNMCSDRWYKLARSIICVHKYGTSQLGAEYVYSKWYQIARSRICVHTDGTRYLGAEYVYRQMVPVSQEQQGEQIGNQTEQPA